MLRKFIFFMTLIWAISISAQEIKVVRFGIIPGDNTAETSPRQDLSDSLCAIVKVKANGLTGLRFTNKNQYVGDIDFKDGIYYVYIPTVTNKLSFSHESYLPGVIDMALFGYKKSIKGGKTYEAILEPASLKPSITGISFKISPHVKNGNVIVDDHVTPMTDDGILNIDCEEGVHRYQIKAENYKPVAGTVNVTNRYEPVIITLQPQTVPVNISVTPDYAHIYVDNIDYGKSGSIQLPLGKHSIRVSAKGYIDHKSDYFITKETNQISDINLDKNKGKVETIYPVEVYVECNTTKLYKNNKEVDGRVLKIMPGTKCRLSDDYGKGAILKVPANQRKPMKIRLSDGYITIDSLLEGSHSVTPSLSGYTSKSSSVNSVGLNFTDYQTFTVNGVSFEMKKVEGGTFTMGATSEQSDTWSDEKPTHRVTLSSFLIGKYEVTQELWKAVMENNPSYFKGDNLPVECVGWDDSQQFISRLNALTGKKFRLPTEAEWEYAARGGNKSRHYKYSGSENPDAVAWYGGNSNKKTHPVGTKYPNELGLYDMSGNVWEWCQDLYGAYSSSPLTNPTGPSSGATRVNRGGCWYGSAGRCRMSSRCGSDPDYRYYDLGLRLVLSE